MYVSTKIVSLTESAFLSLCHIMITNGHVSFQILRYLQRCHDVTLKCIISKFSTTKILKIDPQTFQSIFSVILRQNFMMSIQYLSID